MKMEERLQNKIYKYEWGHFIKATPDEFNSAFLLFWSTINVFLHFKNMCVFVFSTTYSAQLWKNENDQQLRNKFTT